MSNKHRFGFAHRKGQQQQPPNRFLYHVAYHFSFGARSGFATSPIVLPGPISDPAHVAFLAEDFATSLRATDTKTGAPVIGERAIVVVLSWQALRAWFEEEPKEQPAPPVEGERGAEGPEAMPA